MIRRLAFVMLALTAFGVTISLTAFTATPASARKRATPSPSPSPTATPTATPTPLTEAARFDRLRRQLAAISSAAPGRLGITVVDVKQLSRYGARGDEAFPLAGVMELPIAVVAYRRSDQHTFDLGDRVDISASDLRRGAGVIAPAHPHGGVSYTNNELIRLMLTANDATACDVVLREFGGPAVVQTFLNKAGVAGFDIRKTEADLEADGRAHRTFAKGGDNGATPNAIANLLLGVATQEFTHLDSTNELMQTLAESHTGERRLRAGFPADLEFAHGTGTSATDDGATDATNDAGILTLHDGRRVVIVALLAESHASEAVREALLESVSHAVYEAYEP